MSFPRFRTIIAVQVGWLALMFFVGLAIGGCAHREAPVVHIPEPFGGLVSTVLTKTSGGETHIEATAVIPYTVVVFDPTTGPCVIDHEMVHVQDQRELGYVRWKAYYDAGFARCLFGKPPTPLNIGLCYRANPWERKAFEVQERCENEPRRTL